MIPTPSSAQTAAMGPISTFIDRLYHSPFKKRLKKCINYSVVIVSIAGALFLLFPPPLLLSGDSVVNVGGLLHIHGAGFVPSDDVVLTLDGTSSEEKLTSAQSSLTPATPAAAAMQDEATWSETITAGSNGSFNVTIFIDERWSAGLHRMYATEMGTARSVMFPFKVLQPCQDPCVIKPDNILAQSTGSSSRHMAVEREGYMLLGLRRSGEKYV